MEMASRVIGDGQLGFIIAESDVNYNGRLDRAKKLADVAVDAGADTVKFQLFNKENRGT